jgi:hypothetical protein
LALSKPVNAAVAKTKQPGKSTNKTSEVKMSKAANSKKKAKRNLAQSSNAQSMTDAIKEAAGRGTLTKKTSAMEPVLVRPGSLSQSVKQVASQKRKPPSTREGRKGLLIYVDTVVSDAFRRLVREYGATNQVLGERALKLLFEKLGEPWPG